MKRVAMVGVVAVALSFGCAGAPAVQEGGAAAPQGGGGMVPVTALPQPGQCTLWSPERGEKAASAPCNDLTSKVKPGDWLLSRGMKNSGDVQVFVYGELGVIKETYLLDAATGARK